MFGVGKMMGQSMSRGAKGAGVGAAPAATPRMRAPKGPKGMVAMANGGSVKKMSAMAGNAKSGTCGPGVSSRKK